MDLISREAVNNLEKSDTKGSDYDRGWNDALYAVDMLPSAFEGMTNAEVFQAIFPCDEVHINGLQEGIVHFSMKSNPDSMDCFDLEWWNAPYQKGGE